MNETYEKASETELAIVTQKPTPQPKRTTYSLDKMYRHKETLESELERVKGLIEKALELGIKTEAEIQVEEPVAIEE